MSSPSGLATRWAFVGSPSSPKPAGIEIALQAANRRRRLLPVPPPLLRPLLRGYETLTGPAALATWDEAELLAVTMRTPRGTADAESLGVRPQALRAVLGV